MSSEKSSTDTESQHKVIFLSEEDAATPSTVTLAPNEDAPPGLILPNGDINWNCPCLGGMAVGPCGPEFREAFSCFHYSTEEPKGKDCIEKFSTMQECMSQYPELYPEKKKDEEGAEPAAKAEEESDPPAASKPAAEPAAVPAAESSVEAASDSATEKLSDAAVEPAAVAEEKATNNESASSEEGKSDNSASTDENSNSAENVST